MCVLNQALKTYITTGLQKFIYILNASLNKTIITFKKNHNMMVVLKVWFVRVCYFSNPIIGRLPQTK